MTDIELLHQWCKCCLEFPNPLLFRDIQSRGLANLVNNLPTNPTKALSIINEYFETKIKIGKIIEQQNAQKIEANNELRNKQCENAKKYFENLNIPFTFDVGEKEVLSGLSENSHGDGRRKNTTIHLVVLEDIGERLKRKKGDFLCTSVSGTNGNSWSDQNLYIRHINGDGDKYMPTITCKQCLKLLKKYQK